ncbi:MAG: heme-dependent peroxidase [Bryobacterales bacterium]|nr:heme-dependent peroxidase [Bryobacterales bacterium]
MDHNQAEAPAIEQLPAVPLTLEGSSVLHQMFRFRRAAWRTLDDTERAGILAEASAFLSVLEQREDGQSACYSMLGHKGDLLVLHFRGSFEELRDAELALAALRLSDYLETAHSYLSVVELGLYESSLKTYATLADRGLTPFSEDWNAGVEETLAIQRKAMAPRLWPGIPPAKYLCFYPMDRRRGEAMNWYQLPMAERQRQMREHGMIGRRYHGAVRQIISGSMGLDDWEWGVDLFAEDPVTFKKLIYEMRFDKVSAIYALFGPFYIGIRTPAAELGSLFAVEPPR